MRIFNSRTGLWFCALLVLAAGGLAKGQLSKGDAAPPDDFADENKRLLEERREIEREMREGHEENKDDPAVTQFAVADEDPGSTGLKLVGHSTKKASANSIFQTMTWSVLNKFSHGTTPTQSSVITEVAKTVLKSPKNAAQSRYDFANGLAVDPGYVADPLWANNGSVLVMKAGRHDSYNRYFLYAYDITSKRVHRITSTSLIYPALSTSPNGRYLTYIVGGQVGPVLSDRIELPPRELWVWDIRTRKNTLIGKSDWLPGSYSWKSSSELMYSVSEKVNGHTPAVSYVWNARTGQSQLWRRNALKPVASPDRKFILFQTSRDEKNVAPATAIHTALNTQAGTLTRLKPDIPAALPEDEQVAWAANGRIVFVLREERRDGVPSYRLFAANFPTGKTRSWPMPKVGAWGTLDLLASSSKGRRVFILHREENPIVATRTSISRTSAEILALDLCTGRRQRLWYRGNLLGLNPEAITFQPKFLRD